MNVKNFCNMTQEEKLLLIKDLCARLSYGVQVQHTNTQISGVLHDIISYPLYDKNGNIYDITAATNFFGEGDYVYLEYFKPYLFPLLSMSEEQRNELESLMEVINIPVWGDILTPSTEYYDWLNKNHFDYRGLIEKRLAIDATGLNIY